MNNKKEPWIHVDMGENGTVDFNYYHIATVFDKPNGFVEVVTNAKTTWKFSGEMRVSFLDQWQKIVNKENE